jgi:integrase
MSSAERQKKITPFSYDQLATFLRRAHKDLSRQDATLLLTMADAGLCPGEALALRWQDFDPNGRTLAIERAVSLGEVGPTKTDENRMVDMTPRLTDALTRLQTEIETESLLTAKDPSPRIFPSAADSPMDPSAVAKIFWSILRVAGLPRFRLYDLHHTFATHLLAQGAPITYVAAQLGHARPTTTLAYYAHWLPSGDKEFIDRLEATRSAATGTSGSNAVVSIGVEEIQVRDLKWSRGRELNPRPTDYESVALPLSYPGFSRTCERRGVEFTTLC